MCDGIHAATSYRRRRLTKNIKQFLYHYYIAFSISPKRICKTRICCVNNVITTHNMNTIGRHLFWSFYHNAYHESTTRRYESINLYIEHFWKGYRLSAKHVLTQGTIVTVDKSGIKISGWPLSHVYFARNVDGWQHVHLQFDTLESGPTSSVVTSASTVASASCPSPWASPWPKCATVFSAGALIPQSHANPNR